MANYEATKYDFSGANLSGIQGVNTGIIVPWSDATPPSGFLACDGSAVSRTTYSALFAVIGTTYGSGDGSTTFNVPDLQDRCCLKKGTSTNVGTSGGSSTVTVTGNVPGSLANTTLPVNLIGPHTHTGGNSAGSTRGDPGPQALKFLPATGSAGGSGAHGHNLSANFTGDALSTLQPTLVVLYIIKT